MLHGRAPPPNEVSLPPHLAIPGGGINPFHILNLVDMLIFDDMLTLVIEQVTRCTTVGGHILVSGIEIDVCTWFFYYHVFDVLQR